ncbi:MAG: DUF5058 family protein [Ruthenibacterium sp.]
MDIMQLVNGPAMWIFAGLIIAATVFQSVTLFRLARKYIDKTQLLTQSEIKTCLKTGGVVSIGPALSVFVVALSMISMLGAPFTLMRVGMIGSASTELTAASIGAEMAGVSLGIDALTGKAFTAALWTCAFMSSGYLIFVPLVTRGVGKAINNIVVPAEGQKRSVLAWVLSALLPLLIFSALSFLQARKSVPHLVSLIFAAVLMLLLNLLAGKLKQKWMKEWAMCLSVLGGIVAGAVTNALL